MSSLGWVRGVNGTLGRLAPRLVAAKMHLAFTTPQHRLPSDWELPVLARAERVTLRFGLSALRWGGGSHGVAHAWLGRASNPIRQFDRGLGHCGLYRCGA